MADGLGREGVAPSLDKWGGGALSQELSDVAGMLGAPMAACWYGSQGGLKGGAAPSPNGGGGAVPGAARCSKDAVGPIATCWYGGHGTTQPPAPSAHGWPPRAKAARVPRRSPNGWE